MKNTNKNKKINNLFLILNDLSFLDNFFQIEESLKCLNDKIKKNDIENKDCKK